MRHDPDAAPRRHPCPHCKEELWLDLGRPSTALAVRVAEEESLRAPSVYSKVVVNATGASAAAAFVGVIGFGLVWPTAIAAALTGVAVGLHSFRQRQREGTKRRLLPDRWSMTLAPDGPTKNVATGPIEAAEPLRSPITGTPCIAYEVGLREDDDPQAKLATWALVEQRVASSNIGDVEVSEATHLRLRPHRLGTLSDVELDDAARTWLQARGFAPGGSSLHLFETVVEPGQTVSLARGSGPTAVLHR